MTVFGLTIATPASAEQPTPLCEIGQDIVGSTLADIALHSPNPILIGAGATYKVADLAQAIGTAAIDHQDRWIGAEMVLSDKDAKRLKEIKESGGDLNGDEANAIKQQLRDRIYEMNAANRSPYGYTTAVITQNMPYAMATVGVDMLVEKVLGLAFGKIQDIAIEKIGIFKTVEGFVPGKVNWLVNYGGPLEGMEKYAGWSKLGTRARLSEDAAREAMRDLELKEAANYLKLDRATALKEAAADSLGEIFDKVMTDHPSDKEPVLVSDFRVEAARAAVAAMAPEPQAATPAAVVATPATFAPDPLLQSIRADNPGTWQGYAVRISPPRPTYIAPSPAAQPEEQPDPVFAAQEQANQQSMAQQGDGRTFTLCSDGCPGSNSSWDGRPGQSLESQQSEGD